MLHSHRLFLLGTSSLLLGLSACGSGSYSSSSGDTHTTSGTAAGAGTVTMPAGFSGASQLQGTNNAAVATPATGMVEVVVGSSRTVSLSFTSSDGRSLTGLALSGTNLPAGWSGPASFSCGTVTNGSGCVVNLTYAPTKLEHGTLNLAYVFLDNSAQPQTGAAVNIDYESTPNNNVVAMASPSGQVNAVLGRGTRSVSVNFTTDDGKAASALTFTTDLTMLPAGWTSSAPCPATTIISTGSGCQIVLTYAPTAAGAGTLTLNYTFIDAIGAPRAGTLNIPYASTAANNVAATASPTGQILAVQNSGGQPVVVAFTTDDGKPASGLVVTSKLAALPAGWSSAVGDFACASVATGSGCLLHLTYAPTALTPGILALNYTYQDGAGTPRNGVVNIAYAGTTNDVVIGTPVPAGQINAVITDGAQPGNGTQSVTVNFATGDGRPATALHLVDSGAPLPAGWTYDTAFSCIGINVDSACQLPLSYAPTLPGTGTLLLSFAYINNAGEPKTGSAVIDYRATTNDNVGWTATPAALARVRTGSTNPVTVVFTTDDANTAGGLTITSGLASLPAGWSSASNTFTCDSVSTGTGCSLALSYAPVAAESGGLLTLGYSYTNNAGFPATGTVTLPYGAYTPYLYVVNAGSSTVSACPVNIDDTLATCTVAGAGLSGASAIALSNSYAYVTSPSGNTVSQCALGSAGALTNCSATGGGFVFATPAHLAINASNTFAYVDTSAGLVVCAIGPSDGALSSCSAASIAYDPFNGVALSADGTIAYGVHLVDPSNPGNSPTVLDRCSAAAGPLTSCTPMTANTPHNDAALTIANQNLYAVSQGSLYACPINADSTISSCQTTAVGTNPQALAFIDSTAYLANASSAILRCTTNVDGTLGSCTASNDPTFGGTSGMALRQ